jgi:hypothetical protein
MTDGSAHEAQAPSEPIPSSPPPSESMALMPIQAGVVVWTRRQLLAASGHRPVDDTKLALERIRKGIRSKVWKEAVRCAETMLEIGGVRKPGEDESSELGRAKRIEITVVESGRGAEAESDTHGLELRAGGGAGDEG